MSESGLPAELERWKHATGAATAGPWEAHSHQRQYSIWHDELNQPLAREVRAWDDAVFMSAASVAMPRLLAAVEAALKLHQPHVRRQNWPPVCSYDNRRWPCPEVAAITAALAGKEAD